MITKAAANSAELRHRFAQEMLLTGVLSNMKVTCQGNTWNLHEHIVCKKSEFFRTEIERLRTDSGTSIDLSGEDPNTVRTILEFVYTNDYLYLCDTPNVCEHGPGDYFADKCVTHHASSLLTDADLYILAEKYDITGLQQIAIDKFERTCTEHWASVKFVMAAAMILKHTRPEDIGLRDIITEVFADHPERLKDVEVRRLFRRFEGFAVEVLDQIANKKLEETEEAAANVGT